MNKTILITGSTDGIGKLAALNLAKAGHSVYLHGRNADKLAKVIEEVKAVATNANKDSIGGFVADLSDLNDVHNMVKAVEAKLTKLDVLINNAGIFSTSNPITKDGLDVRFVVNYLAPHELTQGLLPLLKASSQARIVNLSSAAQSPVSYEALVGHKKLDDNTAYAQSKLALTIWSMGLAAKLEDDNINVIAVNPGSLLNTKMANEAYGKHWSSADKGANILIELATSDEFANDSGKFFDNDISNGEHGDKKGEFGRPHPDALDKQIIAELEQQTQQLVSSLDLHKA